MGDELWCFAYDPEIKSRVQYGLVKGPPQKKLWFQKSKVKRMFAIFFFNYKDIIHKEFVPPSQTVNKEYYAGVMDFLLKWIQSVQPELYAGMNFFLLHHNVRPPIP